MSEKPKLPTALEFSPGVFKEEGADVLFTLLDLVVDVGGDPDDVKTRIHRNWFTGAASSRNDPGERQIQQMKLAGNVISAMKQYGLIQNSESGPLELTGIGHEIRDLSGDKNLALRKLAIFLLRERHGMDLLDAARSVMRQHGTVKKELVDRELESRGFKIPTNTGNSNKLRMWLEPSGVVNKSWQIDKDVFTDLVGSTSSDITEFNLLTPSQRSVIEALRVRAEADPSPIFSHDLLDLLRIKGDSFNPAQVKKEIYAPLVEKGWINHESKGGGRGSKGGSLSLTEKAMTFDPSVATGLTMGDIPADLREQLGTPLATVMRDLNDESTHVRGIALELLAMKICADLGLLPAQLRLRGAQTGGAEVDLVAEGAHLHFSRWLFQCKNQASNVSLAVLAKEVGMATLLRAQVVVLITTSTFSRTVLDYARTASEASAIQIVLLDHVSIENYRKRGGQALRSELHALAQATLTLKREQLHSVPLDD